MYGYSTTPTKILLITIWKELECMVIVQHLPKSYWLLLEMNLNVLSQYNTHQNLADYHLRGITWSYCIVLVYEQSKSCWYRSSKWKNTSNIFRCITQYTNMISFSLLIEKKTVQTIWTKGEHTVPCYLVVSSINIIDLEYELALGVG